MLYNLQAFFCQHQKVFQAVLQVEGWPHLDSLLTRCVVKFYLQYRYCSHLWSANRKQQWQRRQGKRQKSNRFRSTIQQLFICIFSCAFLYIFRHCMTSTLNSVISRFVEDGNTRQQLSFRLQSFRILIQLQKNMPTFGKVSEMEKARWSLKQWEFTFIVLLSRPSPSLLLKLPVVHAYNLLRCFGVG